jgi:ribonuclease HI
MATPRRQVWTDGACKGNPGPGGWAWVADDGRWESGAEARSTNQRMEIMAAYRAVLAHDEPVTVVSDSTYVVNCFRDRWWEGWLKRDWRNSQRKPVANRDLWEPFIELYRSRTDVDFEWVKGHSGHEMNDVADRLAVAAAESQTERSGEQIPDELGEPDVIHEEWEPHPDRDRRLPAGHLVGVFGARPPELGGYDANPVSDAVGRRLQQILAAKAVLHDDLHVVSGLRLGAEMLGAEAAVAEGLPLVAVLPFPDADAPWPEGSRRRFAQLRDAAAAEILLERKVPDSKAKVGGSLRRRDAWLAKNLDEAIVVWDGAEPFVGRLVATLRDRLGDDVWEEPIPS